MDSTQQQHIVELVTTNNQPSEQEQQDDNQITPLLSTRQAEITNSNKPKINIFTVSYPRKKSNKDQIARLIEAEVSPFTQIVAWVWGGSRWSGLLCVVLSACVYCLMELLMDVFSAQAIPLFEIAFTRCVVISILSYIWLRRSGEPIVGPANVRNLLVSRALTGCLSLLTFIYWIQYGKLNPYDCMPHVTEMHPFVLPLSIQRLPLSQAMILSFTTPIMASVAARFILHENLKIAEVAGWIRWLSSLPLETEVKGSILTPCKAGGPFLPFIKPEASLSWVGVWLSTSQPPPYTVEDGIAFSFFGVLFILGSATSIEEVGEAKAPGVYGLRHAFAVLIGLVSSLAGGVSCCFVRAGAKASDQPVGTIFSFGILSSAAAAICMITTEDFVLPSFYSFILMIVLSILAFFAELFLARGLQLEKTSKVANILYLEVALFQLWGMGSSRVVPSFGKLVGCFLILVSACCTVYFGPEKEME
ncbi:hypothetical protein Tco_1184868 [Tanacetum coccineum]